MGGTKHRHTLHATTRVSPENIFLVKEPDTQAAFCLIPFIHNVQNRDRKWVSVYQALGESAKQEGGDGLLGVGVSELTKEFWNETVMMAA